MKKKYVWELNSWLGYCLKIYWSWTDYLPSFDVHTICKFYNKSWVQKCTAQFGTVLDNWGSFTMIYIQKFLDSDWLRVMQFLGNTMQK